MSVTEWLDEATPDRREVSVCFNRRLVSELVAAKAELASADGERNLGDGLKARIAGLEAQVREQSRTLAFEGIGWGAWRDLIAKHPPAPDQQEVFDRAVRLAFMPHSVENIGFSAETFIPAAIAASCVDPGMTVEEATALLTKTPAGVIDRVWTAVLDANLSGGNDPFVGAVLAASSGGAAPSAKKSKRLSR